MGEVIPREEVEKAAAQVAGSSGPNPSAATQIPRFEAHCDYLSAWEEDKYIIAQANVAMDENGRIVRNWSTPARPATSC